MKKSELNLMVIQNFILYVTHASEGDTDANTPITLTANELYEMAIDYIEEDHADGKENPEDDIAKYWVESSFVTEDKEKTHPEQMVVAVDMGEQGTETLASFDVALKSELEILINHFNTH